MARYLIERTFPDGLAIPIDADGAESCRAVVRSNAESDVTWVHSYVTTDRKRSFCIYDAPNPEAIRRAGERNGLPVDSVTEIRVLDPYFYW